VTEIELGRVTDRKPPFKYSAIARVWFSDTDAQGVVYYGRYLPYFDHARVEYHRHLGRGLGADRFGQWVLCTAWASLLTVAADLGFGVLLTRDGAVVHPNFQPKAA